MRFKKWYSISCKWGKLTDIVIEKENQFYSFTCTWFTQKRVKREKKEMNIKSEEMNIKSEKNELIKNLKSKEKIWKEMWNEKWVKREKNWNSFVR